MTSHLVSKRFCRRTAMVAAIAAIGLSANAETATFTNVSQNIKANTWWTHSSWGNPAIWTVGDPPTALTVAPTNGQDIAFPPVGWTIPGSDGKYSMPSAMRISTGELVGADSNAHLGNGAVDPIVGKVSGDTTYLIRHAEPWGAQCQPMRWFKVADPNDFLGYWTVNNCMAGFDLVGASSTFTPELHSLQIRYRPIVRVPESGKAVIGDLQGVGALHKQGGGELEIAGGGTRQNVYVDEGTLTLRGRDSDDIKSLIARSALHLDASDASTLTTTTEAKHGFSGYTWVTKWTDAVHGVGGASEDLSTHTGEYWVPWCLPGFIAPQCSPTGLPLVSFGSNIDTVDIDRFGPTNCMMKLDNRMTNVREAFYVAQFPQSSVASSSTVLGDASTYHFIADGAMFRDYGIGVQNDDDSERIHRIRNNGGEVRIDNVRWPIGDLDYGNSEYRALTNLMVVSVAASTNSTVGAIGCERYYKYRSGGFRLGELLVFTEPLTRAERGRINEYLHSKWIGGDVSADVGVLMARTNELSVGVSGEGKTARVNTLSMSDKGGTLVKKGEGTLEIGRFETPPGSGVDAVRIDGGSVMFNDTEGQPETSAPAANPQLWLDASDVTTVETYQNGVLYPGTNFVAGWKDVRQGVNLVAAPLTNCYPEMSESSVRYPTYTVFNGHRVIDFGSRAGVDTSHMVMPWGRHASSAQHGSYAGFMVVRTLIPRYSSGFFSNSGMMFYRYDGTLLSAFYRNRDSQPMRWSLNGKVCDPWDSDKTGRVWTTLNQTNDFFVVSFSSPAWSTLVDLIAQDRDPTVPTYSGGGMQIAEVLLYDRPLNDRERHGTETYLMAKYGIGSGSADVSEVAVDTVDVADGMAARIGAGGDTVLKVASVTGGNGEFVKEGDGAMMLAKASDITSFTVKGGTLSWREADALKREALFHFDANDSDDAFSTYQAIGPDAETTETYVSHWRDTRRNGTYAYGTSLWSDFGGLYAMHTWTNPVLREVETAPGVQNRVVDFGQGRHFFATNGKNGEFRKPDGSAYSREDPYVKWYDESSMMFSKTFKTVREAVCVMANHGDGVRVFADDAQTQSYGLNYSGQIFGVGPGSEAIDFARGAENNYYLFSKTYVNGNIRTLMVSDNYDDTIITLDGERVYWNTKLAGTDFHVISAATSNEAPATINAFAMDRNCSAGGVLIGEQIAFDRRLTEKERTYLVGSLMHKWKGASAVCWTNSIDSLSVASGATFDVGDDALEVGALAGGGTVSCGTLSLNEGASLAFEIRSSVDYDSMTVSGALKLPADAKLTVTTPNAKLIDEGEYVLLTANGGLECAGSMPTLDHNFAPRRSLAISVKGDALVARVSKIGFLINIR